MDKTQTKKLSTALVGFIIFLALLCMIWYLPGMGLIGSMSLLYLPVFIAALPLILVYVYVACGYYYGTAVSILGFGIAALLGVSVSLYLAAAFLPLVLTAGYTIVSNKRFRTSVALSAVAALAGVSLVFLMVSLSSGTTVVDYAVSQYSKELYAFSDKDVTFLYGVARYNDVLSGAITQAAIDSTSAADAIFNMQEIARQDLNLSIVYLMIVYSLGAGYLAYIIPRAIVKKQGRFVSDIPKLKDYELPNKLWLAALVFTAAAFIGNNYGIRGFDILLLTTFRVFVFVFMVQGFCLMVYFFDQQKMKKGIRAFLIIAALLFLRTIALPIIGLFENMFGFRKRMKQGKEQA